MSENHAGKTSLKKFRVTDEIVKLAFVSTWVPRQCGIATFCSDLVGAIREESPNIQCQIFAANRPQEHFTYDSKVAFELNDDKEEDYRSVADYINMSNTALVCIQHEFGIFGGQDGSYLLSLLEELRKPVVAVLHTVLEEPTLNQRRVANKLIERSFVLIVMTNRSKRILEEVYKVPSSKIRIIPHGVPDLPFVDPSFYKDQFALEGRKVLLTFGLLSPNKGVEVVLKALPPLIKEFPAITFVVLGATHPDVKRQSGEQYRASLELLTKKLGLEKHVLFYNRYLKSEELYNFLSAADIYLSPYLTREQAVSGTLAFALGSGKAIISTPYWYAEEVLAEERGLLFDFQDSKALTQQIRRYLVDDLFYQQCRKRAYLFARDTTWRQVARRYLELFQEIYNDPAQTVNIPLQNIVTSPITLLQINLGHLQLLTDDTGIFQHATSFTPRRKDGYTTDDNARAFLLILKNFEVSRVNEVLPLAHNYLSFLDYAQLPDGRFHNFMDYDRKWLDKEGSDDSLGRSVWALGYAVSRAPQEQIRRLSRQLFEHALPALENLPSPRAVAYSMLGLYYYLEHYAGATGIRRQLETLAVKMSQWYKNSVTPDWRWFENVISYANAKLPQAMLMAGKALERKDLINIGLESLDFLTKLYWKEDHFSLVGNQGWYRKGETIPRFAQQPIDAADLVECYGWAYRVTGDLDYLNKMQSAYEWFLGNNDLNLPLCDFRSGGCADGLEATEVSQNFGSESTISFLLALHEMYQIRAETEIKQLPADIQKESLENQQSI